MTNKKDKLPSLKDMEQEIVEAFDNLDIVKLGEQLYIGNKFGTASVIYNLFKSKLK